MTKRPARKRNPGGRAKAVTIRDIAQEAGVSTATVSRVFNRPDTVSQKTRDSVLTVSARHHYISDGFAAGLASRRSRTLGLVIPTIMNSIYADSTQAIQRAAQRAGYSVLVGIAEFSAEQEEKLIHRLLEQRVEGLILTGARRSPTVYAKLERNDIPFVITWKITGDLKRPAVSFDNYKAASAAVEYLISLGHRRIGLICGRTDVNDRALDRRQAYEDTMSGHGLTVDPALIIERDFEFVEGRAAMHRMLAQAEPPTAVFSANDIQAIGALYECGEAGLRVPQDLSIVGFDDQPIAHYTLPQLTTIRVPAADMGRRAAEAIIASIEDGEQLVSLELPTDLIIRGSTGPAPRR